METLKDPKDIDYVLTYGCVTGLIVDVNVDYSDPGTSYRVNLDPFDKETEELLKDVIHRKLKTVRNKRREEIQKEIESLNKELDNL